MAKSTSAFCFSCFSFCTTVPGLDLTITMSKCASTKAFAPFLCLGRGRLRLLGLLGALLDQFCNQYRGQHRLQLGRASTHPRRLARPRVPA